MGEGSIMKRGRGGRARKEQGREGEGEGCYLDSIGRLFESDQHIPVSSAGRVPGTELRGQGGDGRKRGKHRGEVTSHRRVAGRPHSTAHAGPSLRRPPHPQQPHMGQAQQSPLPAPARAVGEGSPRPRSPQ